MILRGRVIRLARSEVPNTLSFGLPRPGMRALRNIHHTPDLDVRHLYIGAPGS